MKTDNLNQLVNFNGELLPSDSLLFSSNNRGFSYGDGLFETIRMADDSIPFLLIHYNRLIKGMNYLGIVVPETFTLEFVKQEIQKIATGNQRIRFTLTRKAGGKYFPNNNQFDYLIESEVLTSNRFNLNSKGKRLTIFKDEYLSCTPLSNLKTCNALPYILASRYFHEEGFDDALLLNQYGRIAEASSSNIFLVKNGTVSTPALSEGCVGGVMRNVVIRLLLIQQTPLKQTEITVDQVSEADEVWLTNSIQGIQWCVSLGDKIFRKEMAERFLYKLNWVAE